MERVKRRWWTWTVSILAGLVIIAAGISGLFQLAVMSLPNYRNDLAVWVTQVAGRPVQIGGVNLVWRGIRPRLDLSDITLYSENGDDEALTAQRLSLGFGLGRLITGDYTPNRVELSGLSLRVHVDKGGKITIAGFEAAPQNAQIDLRTWLRELERFSKVRLENCALTLDDERLGVTQLRFSLKSAEAVQTLIGFNVEGQLQLPVAYGDTLSFEAAIHGAVSEPDEWNGDFSAQAAGLAPQPWLRGRVAPGTRVGAEDLAADIKGEISAGRLSSLSMKLSSGALLASRAGRSVAVKSLKASAQLQRDGNGWMLDFSKLALDGENQVHGRVHYQPVAGGEGYELDADADVLRLGRLTPWLQFVRDLPQALERAPDISGELSGLVLRLRQAPEGSQYSLRAELKNLALQANGSALGFAGLNGELSADENGGRFKLAGTPLRLDLPQVFGTPVPFDTLSGQAQWKRRAEGWQLSMPGFGWSLASSEGRGQFELLLPADSARSPELDLSANFSAGDANALKPYIPLSWGQELKDWLERAIEAGRVPRAQLLIRGPLADFPFQDKSSGEWKLDLDVAGARLAYVPGWPVAENVQARLQFKGNGLTIESDAAQLSGNRVERVLARFADFRDHLLTIDGAVSGETRRFYDFLRNSPLREKLDGLINNTRAAGPARVGVHLDIPLQESRQTSVSGIVSLNGVQLYYGNLREPVNGIQGDIFFSAGGVTSERLTASFEDLALKAHIETRAQTSGVVVAEFPFTPKADGAGVSGYIPALVRGALTGESRWRAELPLGDSDAVLTLLSDLRGTRVSLPAPLAKGADEAVPISIVIGADQAAPLRLRVSYENRLGADLALRQQGANWVARGVHLHLGKGATPRADEGLFVSGEAAELDLAAWSGVLRGGQLDGVALRQADLRVQKLFFGGQSLRDMHVLYTPAEDGWRAKLDGAGAEGDLLWSNAGGGRLSANLAHLDLDYQPPAEGEKSAAARTFNPADWPVLDLNCAQFRLGAADFGQVKLSTARIAGGQRLENFAATGGKTEASASGEWLRAQEQSSAKLKFDFSSTDFAAVLKSLGYAQNLSARSSRFSGALEWAPDAAGVVWEQARGKISLDFQAGTLKAVEPGAGRVLGLLNFYALPRRLTLDFRDVVKSGLAFDKITGDFELGNGAAVTNDLKIDATSLRMEMRGRVGLVARDYDQRVTVYPDVSSGFTLGAALLGGPALGALAFIAQEVLDKPLDQATQLSYQVTGSWDNPQVKRVEQATPADTNADVPVH